VTQQPSGSGPDLIGEFQRWLIRSSARGVGRQVTGQIRSALGQNQKQQSTGDVWETATTEPPDEAPECAWCPLCRAARLLRESKPGRDTRVTAVSDALGTVVQDAFSVLEAALATTGRPAGSGAAKTAPRSAGPGSAAPRSAGPGPATPAKTGQDGKGGGTQPAGSGPAKAGQASDVWSAASGPAPTAPAQTGPAQTGPAQTGPAQTGPATAGQEGNSASAAKQGRGGEPGTAGQGPGKEPTPDSPEGSPHEPDDRG
jgi:hypothetical protein